MKRLITTLLISILSLGAMAQFNELSTNLKNGRTSNTRNSNGSNTGSNGFSRDGKIKEDGKDKMSAADSARLLIKPKMDLSRWMHNGVYRKLTKRDTTIDGAHIYDPYFNKSISNTYLSNVMSPHISNIFIDRDYRTENLFLKVYDAYLNRPEDHLDVNTTTPFTLIEYKTGGSKTHGENCLKVIHTQNINPFLNVGINYNYFSGDGAYMHNNSKIYDFAAFASYNKDRLSLNFFINNNIGHFQENGGIEDPKYIRDTSMRAENIPIKLQFPETDFNNSNIRTTIQYNIGKESEIILPKDTIKYYPFKVTYSFQSESNERKFRESSLTEDYFDNNYISDTKTSDKNYYSYKHHSTRFVWNEKMKSLAPGMYVGASIKEKKYTYFSESPFPNANTLNPEFGDSKTLKLQYSTKNRLERTSYLEGGIFKQDSGKINFDFNAKVGIYGNNKNEKYLNADFAYNINANNTLALSGRYSNKAPDYNLNYYLSNHYKWNNNFKDEGNIELKAIFLNKKLNLEIGVTRNKLINHIYFGLDQLPTQNDTEININTAYLKHKFKLWRFHFINKLYYQSTNSTDIDLPDLCYFGSYYYKGFLSNNALLFELGANLSYNTKFYAPSYNVATNSFYRQDQEKFGDYPKIDLFANFKIKRMIIFIKYEHLTYHFGNNDYFLNSYYPMNPATLKYGFKWIFND